MGWVQGARLWSQRLACRMGWVQGARLWSQRLARGMGWVPGACLWYGPVLGAGLCSGWCAPAGSLGSVVVVVGRLMWCGTLAFERRFSIHPIVATIQC
eukprot:gene25810-biopygen19524